MTRTVRLGTRGSALAVTQAGLVAHLIARRAADLGLDLAVKIVEIRTRGDVDPSALARLGGVGVFAAALREALIDGDCDLAVHSFKDLPTGPVPGLRIAAVPQREDPRDALCTAGGASGRRLDDLAPTARIGTGSPRRAAQLLAVRPDLRIVPVRGNVPTRLSRVLGKGVREDGPMGAAREPDLDGVVLALAGLRRLELDGHVSEILSADSRTGAPVMVPAAAQGALAVETRDSLDREDPQLAQVLADLDDPATRAAATAERAVLARLGAGCAAPVGALARLTVEGGDALRLEAVVAALDGRTVLRESAVGPLSEAQVLGTRVAQALLTAGRLRVQKGPAVSAAGGGPAGGGPLAGRRVLLPRIKNKDALAAGLRAAGAEVEAVEVTRARPGPAGPRARAAADLTAGAYAWLIVSSPRALDHVDLTGLPATTGLAVVGEATARRVTRALGRRADLVGAGSSAALIDLEPLSAGPAPGATGAARRILLPGSALRGTTLIDGLTAAGWAVDEVPAYTMEPVALSDLPGGFVGRWSTGAFDAVVLTAGSSSRALAGLAGTPPSSTRVAALGRPTAAAAGEAGFVVDVVASSPTPPGVRAAVVDALSSRPRRTPFSAREDEPHE